MPTLGNITSSIAQKPYRHWHVKDIVPYLNENGHVDFHPHDIENPRNWSTTRKWYITCAATFLVLNGNFASALPSGSLGSISDDFGISETAAGLTITLYLLGYCVGPFIFAPLSEFYGRRWIFYVTFGLYMAFTFLCAFAHNFAALLVGRFFAGNFASASLTNVPGVLADIWDPTERGNAMAVFSLVVWTGPSLGPIVAGFLEMSKGWRWGFYVALWLAAAGAVLMFTLPETHNPTILSRKATVARMSQNPACKHVQSPAQADTPSLKVMYKKALTLPWILLFDTISFLCALYMFFIYTLQYMLFSIYPIVFQDMRGWNPGVGQLPLLGTIIGSFLGAAIAFLDTRRRRNMVTRRGAQLEVEPEDRLYIAMAGGIGFAVTMFWFAWTANFNSIHWMVPTLAGTFLSTSLIIIFVSYTNYFVDTYFQYAATAVAVNTFARSIGSAAAPLFTGSMFDALGVGGGGSLIAGVATILSVIPFGFYRYGKQIRRKSQYAWTMPDAPSKQPDEEQGMPGSTTAEREEAEKVWSRQTGTSMDSEALNLRSHSTEGETLSVMHETRDE